MDIRKVKKLIEMLEASNLEELEIQEGEESVRLVKKQPYSSQSAVNNSQQEIAVDFESNTKGKSTTTSEGNNEEVMKGNTITSPMVGTYYSAPSPGAKPFVSIGDEINEGDIICIVEAMKMMNEIKSDFSGKVSLIYVENTEPVEFGQPLFLVS